MGRFRECCMRDTRYRPSSIFRRFEAESFWTAPSRCLWPSLGFMGLATLASSRGYPGTRMFQFRSLRGQDK